MALLFPAALLTGATLLLAVLWRVVRLVLRRPAPGFWRRTLRWHAALLFLHLFVTVPVALGSALPHLAGTRPDERGYSGPRFGQDGSWLLQSRESLRAERGDSAEVGAGDSESDSPYAVSFAAQDGVPLRGYLVPPAGAEAPRFSAVVVHGLFRGALEIEAPASLLRDLGGEVLLLELRNHGGSGRAPLTLGRDEALDVRAAVEFLRARPGGAAERPLVVFAVSLGTAAAALAAPEIEGLDGLVLDAPLDDASSTAKRVLAAGGPWSSIRDPWATLLLLSARFFGGVPLGGEQPRDALTRLSPGVAVLLIGQGRDRRMPPETVRALFESLPTPADRKQLWIEPEATHGKAWVSAPEEYRRRLAWLCREAARPVPGESAAPETAGG